jgi:hypothetical protein
MGVRGGRGGVGVSGPCMYVAYSIQCRIVYDICLYVCMYVCTYVCMPYLIFSLSSSKSTAYAPSLSSCSISFESILGPCVYVSE